MVLVPEYWFSFFPTSVFWSGNLFLIAPFPDRCLLVPFYIEKTGVCRGIPIIFFFLFLLQNIDCGYSLEPPRQTMF